MIRTNQLSWRWLWLALMAIAPALHAAPATQEADADRPTRAALNRTLPEIRFDNTGFADVIDFYRDITGMNFYVNWTELQKNGVDRNAPVTLRLRDTKLSKVLDLTLDQLNGKQKVTWSVDAGVVIVSTAADLNKDVVKEKYDVSFLAAWRHGGAAADDPLLNMIRGSIAPDSWGDAGPGKLEEKDGQLTVTATEENQKRLGNLLDNLKKLVGSSQVEKQLPVPGSGNRE